MAYCNSNRNVWFCNIHVVGIDPAIGLCWFERQLNLSVVVSEYVV